MPLLLVTDGRSNDYIQLPRDQVIEPAMNAQALAIELDRLLEAASQRIFGGDRAGAVGLLGNARFRIQSFRAEWHHIAGLAEAAPACLDGVLTFTGPDGFGGGSGAGDRSAGVSPQADPEAAGVVARA